MPRYISSEEFHRKSKQKNYFNYLVGNFIKRTKCERNLKVKQRICRIIQEGNYRILSEI